MQIISLDSETTGLDCEHGCRVFFVTISSLEETLYWEWNVDPLTRKPSISNKDIFEIRKILSNAEQVILQNAKFDVKMLFASGVLSKDSWDWSKVRDTQLAGHLLASNQPIDLTTLAAVYLSTNIKPFEEAIKKATKEAKRYCDKHYPDWKQAVEDMPELPSAKGALWANDMWLCRALAIHENYPEDHEYHSVLRDYANVDSQVTLRIHQEQLKRIQQQGLEKIYAERLKMLPIVFGMEQTGVTLSKAKLKELLLVYQEESSNAEKTCLNVAKQHNYDLVLPKGAVNKSLTNFVFGYDELDEEGNFIKTIPNLGLPAVKVSKKTKAPSLDKDCLEEYAASLEPGLALDFVQALSAKRKRDTAISFMTSYQKFWLRTNKPGWYKLFPNLNPTGTNTLRWSSNNPNEQNISKKEGFNLRYMFGPAPGREWWSLDAKNIELRIPAYEAEETEMIDLFENPDKAPYFGSNHMLIFDTLHPEKFAEHGIQVKKVFASTWYQWTKNGNFAVQYGAQNMLDGTGTADRAYHVPGAQTLIEKRFQKIKKLNEKMIAQANKYGYVRTMPDKTVDKSKGYPLVCTTTKWGKIKPTVPLNYHVQGTAMWWMMKAMIRCQEYLNEINAKIEGTTKQFFMVMQVHDELVFDFPKGASHLTNLPKIRKIKRLMEQSGDDIGLPTPVSCEYHSGNWSEGIAV